MEKLIPACAKLALEDDMPGKIFALLEEILLALSLYSEGLQDAKLHALLEVVINKVVLPVMQGENPSLGNLVNSLNLLRFFALLQDPLATGSGATKIIMQALH